MTSSLTEVAIPNPEPFSRLTNGEIVLDQPIPAIDLKLYNWTTKVKGIKAPIRIAIDDADGVRYDHALELYKAKRGRKQGDLAGVPKSRLSILPGTTHVGMFMQHEDWLIPMITDFLDSDFNEKPPTFEN